jgi:DNA polymerase-3 subunit alpha
MTTEFIHLHLHTEYSLLDGIVRIKPLVEAVVADQMPAVAVTDQGNLFAMVKFYRAAVARGVKPIIGADVWLHNERDPTVPNRLVLLAQHDVGYRNLAGLISRSYLEGQQAGRPTVRLQWLRGGAAQGLIALSAGREGDVGRALLAANTELASALLEQWLELFGDRFYLELQRTGREGEEKYLHGAIELATRHSVAVVATNDVRFLWSEDFEAHEARVCIHQGRILDDPRRPRSYSQEQYLRSHREMVELFADLPEALENTVEIAKRCNVELRLGQNFLPSFPVPDGLTPGEYLIEQAREGLKGRLASAAGAGARSAAPSREEYAQRLSRELDVVVQMGFAGYFLIVADFIRWARENDIPVGPGRGSGAGSLVAFSLGITDLDPIKYELLFERFLNPERVSMPDFDVDFCMEGRDRVIEYVAERYGRQKVSQIITYGSMAARAVVRDVGRVQGYPYGFVDKIAKLIPFEIGMTLDKALEQNPELHTRYEQDEEIRSLIDLARSLEGLARNAGKHAGGVVIAPSVLTDFTPLYCEPGAGSVVTQFDKDDVEAVGLVKFDFLGLRTLTIIDWAVKAINRQRRESGESELRISAIALDDPQTFELLRRCATTAVFQLESRGMKELIRRLQPDCFDDIVALVALFRPGPLQSGMVDDFINRKHGRAEVHYPHPALKPILSSTYGVILYQEQVMQIAQVLGGYTLGGADLLRRAMGKKKPAEMAKQRSIFLEGCIQRGVEADTARYIFDLMEKFAGYGFNKSHSAAYAFLAYQTAWLKAHHPAAFMAAVLSADMDNTDKVVTLIDECREMGLRVEPPHVNRSEYRFTIEGQHTVVYGLGAIKGVGQSAIDAVLGERESAGPIGNLFELCRRIDLRKANRRVLETLIRAGALDALGANRATLMAHLPVALQVAEQCTQTEEAGQADLFGLAPSAELSTAERTLGDLPVHEEWEDDQRLAGEKETLGIYLTGHPIGRYEAELRHFVSARISELGPADSGAYRASNGAARTQTPKQRIVVAGLVVALRRLQRQRGGQMAFLTLDDRSARTEVAVFGVLYERTRDLLAKDRLLVVEGTLGTDDYSGGLRVSADTIYDIDQARQVYAKQLIIRWNGRDSLDGHGFATNLQKTLEPFREGRCPISIDYLGIAARVRVPLGQDWKVRPTDELLRRLRALVGAEQVALEY